MEVSLFLHMYPTTSLQLWEEEEIWLLKMNKKNLFKIQIK